LYCTTEDVARILGLPETEFTNTTQPTQSQVQLLIEQATQEINDTVRTAFPKTGEPDTYQTTDYCNVDEVRPRRSRYSRTGFKFRTRLAPIRSIETLDVWNGDGYVDLVSVGTEGRSKDYWYKRRTVFVNTRLPSTEKDAVKITYTYGVEGIPNSVRDVAAMMTAQLLLQGDDESIILVEGGETNPQLSYQQKMEEWQKRIDNVLSGYKEIPAPYSL